jgi:hypothetical protein
MPDHLLSQPKLFVRYDRTISRNSKIGSTNPKAGIDIGDRLLKRRALRQVVILPDLRHTVTRSSATAITERLVHHRGDGRVLAEHLGAELSELQFHTVDELVETEAPEKFIEITLVDLERPTEAFFEA